MVPWTNKNYPYSMKNLPVKVRHKAIEIANAILEEGKLDEGKAIATGISKAKGEVAGSGTKKKANSKRKS
jgi:uncharacterized protein YdaT